MKRLKMNLKMKKLNKLKIMKLKMNLMNLFEWCVSEGVRSWLSLAYF